MEHALHSVYMLENGLAEAILQRMSATLEMRTNLATLLQRSKVSYEDVNGRPAAEMLRPAVLFQCCMLKVCCKWRSCICVYAWYGILL